MKPKIYDEGIADFLEWLDKQELRRKPKPTSTLTMGVNEKLAAAAKANPESVRVSARGDDGVSVVGGPLPSSIVSVCVEQVFEVDAAGRPVWPKAGAVHEYNPFDSLKR
jgi:hypothetical protein